MATTAAIVKDRTGMYFTVPRAAIKDTNGYDSFHISSGEIMPYLNDLDDLEYEGKGINAVIHNENSLTEYRVVDCIVLEVGGDALVLLEH